MASFTDSNVLGPLTSFSPYRQQLPVEAMKEVGMYKQAQYNEGVQRIQSQIESIAGMDVVRDVDKEYLQSKLNEVGNHLKTVAAGDFSNFQLVNSAGGMVNQISRDNNIVNAVGSTAKYKAGLSAMEQAKKEGKSSPSNEWDYMTQAGEWLNSKDIKQTFNGGYTPYTDVSKKWMDVVKSLHSDLQDVDVAYEQNPDGTPNYQKTLAAMQRISKESVSSEKIETALRANLSPVEQQQLAIDGKYTFRGYDQNALLQHSRSRYESEIASNENTIKKLEGVANISSSNSEKKQQALSAIEGLKRMNGQLSSQLADELDLINKSPDEAKAYLYKNGAIAQFSKAYSWEHNKSNLLDNPVQKSEQWERKFAFDREELNWKKLKDSFDMDLEIKKLQQKDKELAGASTKPDIYGGQSTDVQTPYTAIKNSIFDSKGEIDIKKQQLIKAIPNATLNQIDNAILAYRGGNAEGATIGDKTIPVNLRGVVNSIMELEDSNKRKENTLLTTEKEIENSQQFKDSQANIQKAVASLPNLVFTTPSGEMVNFTQDEIAGYIAKEGPSLKSDANFTSLGYRNIFANGIAAGKELSSKELLLQQAEESGSYKNILDKYRSTIGKEVRKHFENKDAAINKSLLTKTGVYTPKSTEIPIKNDTERTSWESFASGLLDRYKGKEGDTKGGAASLASSDIDKGKNWLTGEDTKDVIYRFFTQGDKTSLIMSKGNEEVFIPLTQNESEGLKGYLNLPTKAHTDIEEAQLGVGTTNPSGKPEDAFYQRYKIPNLKNIDTRADVVQDATDPDKQYIQLYIKTASGWSDILLDEGLDRTQADKYIRNLTDEKIKQLYLADPTVAKEVKAEIKNK